jgi:nucleotide-binding universal stress UspA family protein
MSPRATLRTIVVATDFSANAGVALAWAEHLARQHHAALVLVHALRREPPAAPEFVPWPAESYDEIRTGVKSKLDREIETARRSGVAVEGELGVGSAFEVVTAVAKRRGADLVVVGTRGRTAWRRLLLGSTAARLIRNADCPVLTVREDAGSPRAVRTILVATDFSEDAALAAEAAMRVVGGQGAERRMVLLHAYHVPYEATYLPAPILMDAISAADAQVKRMIQEVAAKLRDTGMAVDTVACEGDPATSILDQAMSVGADIIAMGTHGRSGSDRLLLGSTAECVVAAAPCPVLTVRRALA